MSTRLALDTSSEQVQTYHTQVNLPLSDGTGGGGEEGGEGEGGGGGLGGGRGWPLGEGEGGTSGERRGVNDDESETILKLRIKRLRCERDLAKAEEELAAYRAKIK